ncbi:MAG: hypothetical protein J6033_03055 [Lachnospiraceae bacterium]|nr:hypothetical protein [Lachnospiraceae bacterium]
MDYFKEKNRIRVLLTAVFLGSLPILACLIHVGLSGHRLSDVSLLTSEWNDELFYFKQVEAIVDNGFPRGYFGFNESRALKLSFAAWSPVLVFPWVIWGLIFGWNLFSAFVSNIVFLTIAMVVFALLVRPTLKQTGVLTLLFMSYTTFARYMLSGMPEIICFSMLIVFYAVAINYLNTGKENYKLVILFVMGSLMTLMRPYLVLFLVLPALLLFMKNKKAGLLVSVPVFGITLAGYVAINHYLGAKYFTPLFFTDWVTVFFTEGIGAGIRHFFGTLYYKGKDFIMYSVAGIQAGVAAGAYFCLYLTVIAIFIRQTVRDFSRRKKDGVSNRLIIEAHFLFACVSMLFALLLMYKLIEGSKHLLTFIAVGLFLISLMETKTYKKPVIMALVCVYFLIYKAVFPYDYDICFEDEARSEAISDCGNTLNELIAIDKDAEISFDNTVIWLLSEGEEEEKIPLKWQYLYAVPKGMGINCCEYEYVSGNFENIKSAYIAVPTGGETAAKCEAKGWKLLWSDCEVTFYEKD